MRGAGAEVLHAGIFRREGSLRTSRREDRVISGIVARSGGYVGARNRDGRYAGGSFPNFVATLRRVGGDIDEAIEASDGSWFAGGAVNGAESLVRSLVAGGIDTCFTNPGTSEMHMVAALERTPEIRCLLTLFEGVATGAADGY